MGSRELKQYCELDEETLVLLKFAIAGCPGLRRPGLRPGPGRDRHPAPATVFLWASLRPNPAPKGKPSGLPCRFQSECSGRTGLHFLTELCPRPARTWLPWTRRSCCEHLCDLCDRLWQSHAFPIAFPGSRFNVTTCQRDSRHSLTRACAPDAVHSRFSNRLIRSGSFSPSSRLQDHSIAVQSAAVYHSGNKSE